MAAMFSTIAAGASLAISAAGTTGSFIQAGKQRKKQEQAERAAGKAMEDAKAKLQTNFYEGLSIQKEPYELEREAGLSAAAQLTQAGQAGERGAGEIAGRALALNQQQQAQTRSAMGREMAQLDKLVAGEDSRLRDAGANLDVLEAQAAASAAEQAGIDAQRFQRDALGAGLGAVSSATNAVLPEYLKTNTSQGSATLGAPSTAVAGMDMSATGYMQGQQPQGMNPITGQDTLSGFNRINPISMDPLNVPGLGGMNVFLNPTDFTNPFPIQKR